MSLKLYFDALSQPSRALLIFLQTTNIQFTKCVVNLGKGEHLTEKYKDEISRFQKVPVIVDGDFHLTESIAILRYLCKNNEIPDHLYPKDGQKQARVDEYLEWQHNNIRMFCAMYFQKKWLFPMITGDAPDAKTIERYENRMIDCVNTFERLWLNPGPFITGDKISAADIWAACELEQPRIAGYDPEVGRPVLSKWFKAVRQLLSPHYAEAHKFLNRLASDNNPKQSAKL